jgi:hypothetical protein
MENRTKLDEAQRAWNRMINKIMFWVSFAFAVQLGTAIWSFVDHRKHDNERLEYIDSLFLDSRQSITFDSIRSVIDERLTDSIRSVRAELDVERSARRRETQNIRRETQKLRHRIDSIGPIDRPDL